MKFTFFEAEMKKLKHIIYLVFFVCSSIMSRGQTTQPDRLESKGKESLVSVLSTDEQYNTAIASYQDEVNKNRQNEFAWLNLYKYKRFKDKREDKLNISKEKQKELNALVVEMNAAIPNSFAVQYASYFNNEKTDESFSHLKAAYRINPNETELIDDMLCEAVIRQDPSDIQKFSELLSKQNTYKPSDVEYHRNVLNSIEQNGVLVTYANIDTYPIILMQQLQHYRTDVTIVCAEWLASKNYQSQVGKKLGIATDNAFSLEKLINSKTSKSVYLALTLPHNVLTKNASKLYCTGLAMKVSKDKLENLTSLSYNWEFLFSKKNIEENAELNRNYLLPLLLLKDHYTLQGKEKEAKEVQDLAVRISQRFQVESQIKKHLD
jgi:hypothetical protein